MIKLYSKLIQKYPFLKQASRFVVAGSLNFATNFLIVNILRIITGYNKGWQFNVLFTMGFVVALCQSYFLNKHWTFKEEKGQTGKKGHVEFSQFALVSVGGLIINNIVVYFVNTILGAQLGISEAMWSNVSLFIATGVALLWNFFGYKFFVFKK